ncbi:uncharacterized protein TRIADDRAFT_21464 [Trichoplax adhaerens]|uniref:HID1 domain-containing protein n=1 Tax=Trichoplax adhaerens TaxID=10228 RepID=B3RQA8_TRIAD|nr:hypothetical protein TRIADDRAFT_21464 [Trichoplax adhaerens]EDV28317.1 hypothetical protein TRIADDRAFT_21464 [Trichoplax adhaerens]|eukprot:XP_002110151.1 hypothetical protein TRIADDRAFT_21464 [Trichoplax adhaerens]
MGGTDSKLYFRKAIVQLTTKTMPIDANDDAFWDQFWSESIASVQDIFTLVTAQEIRTLRDEAPSNLATLSIKAVEKLVAASMTACSTPKEQTTGKKYITKALSILIHRLLIYILNCCRLLTRILPYIFEDSDWRGFFWSSVPANTDGAQPLAKSLLNAILDLLFCPDFTVPKHKKAGPETPDDLPSIDSCEYIWEAGVGFATSTPANPQFDRNRTEILKLLLTCFSESLYMLPSADSGNNQWLDYFTSTNNRHALPLFTSLLNTVCSYDPVGYGVPYNHLMFQDAREPLVEIAVQLLVVVLDHEPSTITIDRSAEHDTVRINDNLFCNYLSRIHREEDFTFILRGIILLLNNPLLQTYLPNSCKKIGFYQELLIFLWKVCDCNKKFLYYVLKSSDVLDILVPILYYLNDARCDPARIGLMHIGVFILLLLSGERNFGVRLNKPFSAKVPMDLPVFNGTHIDFLVIVFHKVITTGHQRLAPIFDCLLTVLVNVSPYSKTLSIVASNKLLHLLEAFSTPWFLFSNNNNHHLIFFLLEVFNNIIQYQFDGNSHLVYTIIRKRNIFHQLANLPTDPSTVVKPNKKEDSSDISVAQYQSGTESASDPNNISGSESDTSSDDELSKTGAASMKKKTKKIKKSPRFDSVSPDGHFTPTPEWVLSWKQKLPLQTIMRMLQVLVPQVEKICIDKGLTDESEILKFLQHGTLVGLLPVPHPILIRKYQPNSATTMWFRTYMWGIIYLRNFDPPIWYDTNVKLFEIQRTH